MNCCTKTWCRAYLLLLLVAFLYSCKRSSKEDPLKDIPVNAAFETDPPVAEDVLVKKIKGDKDHLLIIARFLPEQFKEKYLAFYYDSTKLVMRDDGKGDDEKAGDGLFTVKVQANAAAFEQSATALQKEAMKTKRFIFKNRSIIADTILEAFDPKKFTAMEAVSIRNLLPPPPPPSLKDHSLTITALDVVEDPARTYNFCTQTGNIDGPWTFKTLMKELAKTNPGDVITDIQLSDFVTNFFNEWFNTRIVNGESVAGRGFVDRLLQSWRGKSQVLPPPNVPRGKLDMRAVPFKLTAIVNRLDLRGNSGYGKSKAGEARFVFCMMSTQGCDEAPFNIIFEYGVPKKTCADIQEYAREWYALSSMLFTDPQYNASLQAITDQFTLCGTSPLKPKQSSINQVRSNEKTLNEFLWELREFHLDNSTGQLKSATTAQSPAVKYNAKTNNTDVQLLASFVNAKQSAILAGRYKVPLSYSGTPFLGGHDFTGKSGLIPPLRPIGMPSGIEPHHWNGTTTAGASFINSDDARQQFSLNTCSGCHSGETQTGFTMIDPVPYGTPARLSGFLTGTPGIAINGITPVDLDGPNGIMNVPDPAGRASSNSLRKFNDLQRRADDLQALVSSSCVSIFHIKEILMRKQLNAVH